MILNRYDFKHPSWHLWMHAGIEVGRTWFVWYWTVNVFIHKTFDGTKVSSTNNWKWNKYYEWCWIVIHTHEFMVGKLFTKQNRIMENFARNNSNSFILFSCLKKCSFLFKEKKDEFFSFNVLIHWNDDKSISFFFCKHRTKLEKENIAFHRIKIVEAHTKLVTSIWTKMISLGKNAVAKLYVWKSIKKS